MRLVLIDIYLDQTEIYTLSYHYEWGRHDRIIQDTVSRDAFGGWEEMGSGSLSSYSLKELEAARTKTLSIDEMIRMENGTMIRVGARDVIFYDNGQSVIMGWGITLDQDDAFRWLWTGKI